MVGGYLNRIIPSRDRLEANNVIRQEERKSSVAHAVGFGHGEDILVLQLVVVTCGMEGN